MALEYCWAKTLDKENQTIKLSDYFDGIKENEVAKPSLLLQQAVLGPDAKNEINIVQLECVGYDEEEIKTPIIIMKPTDGFSQCKLELSVQGSSMPSFKLVKGSGPVHLIGQIVIEFTDEITDVETGLDEDDLEEEEEEDEEDLKEELEKLKKNGVEDGPKKRKAEKNLKEVPTKTPKMDVEDDEDEDERNSDEGPKKKSNRGKKEKKAPGKARRVK